MQIDEPVVKPQRRGAFVFVMVCPTQSYLKRTFLEHPANLGQKLSGFTFSKLNKLIDIENKE